VAAVVEDAAKKHAQWSVEELGKRLDLPHGGLPFSFFPSQHPIFPDLKSFRDLIRFITALFARPSNKRCIYGYGWIHGHRGFNLIGSDSKFQPWVQDFLVATLIWICGGFMRN
jgi:hypothetical protein